MQFNYFYEDQSNPLQKFPIIFHRNMIHRGPHHTYGSHWHENIEMIYVVSGDGLIYCNQDTVAVSPGDFFLIHSNVIHAISPRTEGIPIVFHCLIIDKLFHDALQLPMTSQKFQRLIRDENIRQIFNALAEEHEQKKNYWQLEFKNLTSHLLVYIFRTYRLSENTLSEEENEKKEIAGRIIHYLYRHLTEDLSVELMSCELGFSKYYVCHIFKDVTGSTITEYYNTLRCQYAYQLLISGQYTVREAAEKSGFHTLSYFSKTYRRYRGVTPSEDRKTAPVLP